MKRTEQVNVRLSKDEKHKLCVAAIARGYTSLSAFIRCSAIAFLGADRELVENQNEQLCPKCKIRLVFDAGTLDCPKCGFQTEA